MRIGIIIPSRMDSVRLPKKPSRIINGRPLIDYVITSALNVVNCSNVILATTDRDIDKWLDEYSKIRRINFFRGSKDDVLSRFVGAIDAFGLDVAVRLNGDSPFARPAMIDAGIELFLQSRPDIVTNVLSRKYPYGLSVEVISAQALRKLLTLDISSEEREHVTLGMYNRPKEFVIGEIRTPQATGANLRLAVDTQQDLTRAEYISKNLGENINKSTLNDIVNLARHYDNSIVEKVDGKSALRVPSRLA